ncbi:hypothetical protein CDV49_08360 [Haematobacter genomosp. 1]|uniref:Uncharacterized protein n=2 Tax=Haematobacter genomosp. 1 TaxID=366618 RepID=A0A212AC02_9RHOB|nr:hypothetical protein CDV49_08360 [Haematobacter genomosp. 1]
MEMTGEDRAARNARQRELYAADPEKYRAKFEEWLRNLSPERLEVWRSHARASQKKYRARRASSQMMADAALLLKMMENTDE